MNNSVEPSGFILFESMDSPDPLFGGAVDIHMLLWLAISSTKDENLPKWDAIKNRGEVFLLPLLLLVIGDGCRGKHPSALHRKSPLMDRNLQSKSRQEPNPRSTEHSIFRSTNAHCHKCVKRERCTLQSPITSSLGPECSASSVELKKKKSSLLETVDIDVDKGC